MKLKVFKFLLLSVLIVVGLTACVSWPENTISQVSTIDALLAGVYKGEMNMNELLAMGNMGIGTFNYLDGEMIVLDGKVYQAKANGKVYTPTMQTKTPFASIVNFQPESRLLLDKDVNYQDLKKLLDKIAPKQNLFYAFKIKGKFKSMKTRSVPRQKEPFPPLAQVVKKQPIFKMQNISGTIVGFRCPAYVKGINVPGYHLHFISDDRKHGGHILQFEMRKGASLEIDCANKFFMLLASSNNAFNTANLKIDRTNELHRVER